jgi:hypothetical protein
MTRAEHAYRKGGSTVGRAGRRPPSRYHVTWIIDSDAESPRAAALEARQAQTRPGTIATVFQVEDTGSGEVICIDLADEGDPQ